MVLILSSAFVFAIAKIQFIPLICRFLCLILLKKKHLDCLRGSIMTHLRKFVSSVPEYRRTSRGNFKYNFEDILMLVILGRLSKCITRAEIFQFGKRHLKRLQAKGLFPYGLPSEATLRRVCFYPFLSYQHATQGYTDILFNKKCLMHRLFSKYPGELHSEFQFLLG